MPPKRTQMQKALAGASYEYYVCARLMQHGLLAALVPKDVPWVDILVFDRERSIGSTVQVKGRASGPDKGWMLGKKHEAYKEARAFYALVDFEPEPPVSYVVPADVVADHVTKAHRGWLAEPGRRGQQRNDTDMRRLRPQATFAADYPDGWMEGYRESWHLLQASPGSLAGGD